MKAPQGARVLVLEDEAIIAIDVENILTDAGLAVAATLGSCADALKWLDANDAEVALLDMHLLDGSCEPVARRLAEKGIPRLWSSQATRKRTRPSTLSSRPASGSRSPRPPTGSSRRSGRR
jgi:DNA-binding response OmpR family regulator